MTTNPTPMQGAAAGQRRGWLRRPREAEVALALAWLAGASLVFWWWPQIDLHVSAWFVDHQGRFVGDDSAVVRAIYLAVPWIGRGLALAALVVALAWYRRPGPLGVRWWRRTLMLGAAMLFIVAGLVNGVLKDQWGRARPVAVVQFGGERAFTPAWQPASQCPRNCSFVSGHAATGFALIAVGLAGTSATRRRWRNIGLACGLVIGLARISQGGHFASDVIVGGFLVWVGACVLRLVWLRIKLGLAKRGAQGRRPFGSPKPMQAPGFDGVDSATAGPAARQGDGRPWPQG